MDDIPCVGSPEDPSGAVNRFRESVFFKGGVIATNRGVPKHRLQPILSTGLLR